MGIKKRWGLRADRVLTINPNAYEKINLNIGVGNAESAESTSQSYNYFLNYQNFFQLFFYIDTLIESYHLHHTEERCIFVVTSEIIAFAHIRYTTLINIIPSRKIHILKVTQNNTPTE